MAMSCAVLYGLGALATRRLCLATPMVVQYATNSAPYADAGLHTVRDSLLWLLVYISGPWTGARVVFQLASRGISML